MISFTMDGIEYRMFDHLYAVSRCGKVLRRMEPCTPAKHPGGYLVLGRQRLMHRVVAAVGWMTLIPPNTSITSMELKPTTERKTLSVSRQKNILVNGITENVENTLERIKRGKSCETSGLVEKIPLRRKLRKLPSLLKSAQNAPACSKVKSILPCPLRPEPLTYSRQPFG